MFAFLFAIILLAFTSVKAGESYEFKAETSRLLDIIVNSLYSDREIFIRELVSNAVDSLEKLRYLSLTDVKLLGDENLPLEIRISADPRKKLLIIEDTGIGMDHDELVRNLGTIAESGTRKFFTENEQDSSSLIGQFGVGFFSSYLVADRVDFETIRSPKGNGDYALGKPLRWSSDAVSNFVITEIDPEEEDVINHRGSRIVLHLRDDALQFCQEKRLEALLKKYSGFMSFPIYLRHEDAVDVEEEVPEAEETEKEVITDENGEKIEVAEVAEEESEEEEEEAPAEEEKKKSEDDEEDEDDEDEFDKEAREAEKKRKEELKKKEKESKKNNKRIVTKYEYKWNEIATGPSIWMKMPSEVKEDEYKDFFAKALKNSDKTIKGEEPIAWSHFRGEGSGTDFRALIYIPSAAPENFYERYSEQHSALRLYINKVFVTNDTDEMLPRWLRFVRGVVDSENLSINLSREMIQENRGIKKIGQRIANTILRKINELFKESFEPVVEEEVKTDEEKPITTEDEATQVPPTEETPVSDEEVKTEAEKDDDYFEEEEKKEETEKKEEEKKKSRDSELDELIKPYHKFFKAFGRTFKFANLEDEKYRNKVTNLMLFMTTKTLSKQYPNESDVTFRKDMVDRLQRDGAEVRDYVNFVSFQQYVDNMPSYQEDIYIISGLTIDDTLASPYVKAAEKRGIEVIVLYDPLDDFIFQNNLKEFKDKNGKTHNIKNISKSDVHLPEPPKDEKDEENKDEGSEMNKKFADELLCEYLRKNIENVAQVKKNDKITGDDVPVMITTASWGISATQERVLKAQHSGAVGQLGIFKNQRHLDYNETHPMIVAMKELLVSLNPMVLEPKVNEEKKKEWEKKKKEAEDKSEEFTEPEPEPELKYTIPSEIKDTPGLKRAAYCLGNTAMYYAGYDVEKKTDFVKSMFNVIEDAVKLGKEFEDKKAEKEVAVEKEEVVVETPEIVEETEEAEPLADNKAENEEVVSSKCEAPQTQQEEDSMLLMKTQGIFFAIPTFMALLSVLIYACKK